MCALFGPEIFQAGEVKGLKDLRVAFSLRKPLGLPSHCKSFEFLALFVRPCVYI